MRTTVRRLSAWDRPSQIALEGLLLLVMLLATVLTAVSVVSLVADREIEVPVTLTEQALETGPGTDLVTAQGVLTLTDVSLTQVATAVAPAVVGAAVVTGAAYCLFLVVRSLREGAPFHRLNARRLIRAALIVLFGGLATGLISTFSTMSLAMQGQDRLGDGSAIVASGFLPLNFVGIGLLLLCLAEFFRRGTELSDDVEGLV